MKLTDNYDEVNFLVDEIETLEMNQIKKEKEHKKTFEELLALKKHLQDTKKALQKLTESLSLIAKDLLKLQRH